MDDEKQIKAGLIRLSCKRRELDVYHMKERHYAEKAREALAKIQRLRRELGV